jgi:motility quorum-sensing regulator/GCU-specific mRNA interferase toxin
MFFTGNNTPHCKLSIVKQLVAADQVRTTRSAREGAAALGFDFDEMLAVVIALTTKDFLRA